MKAKELAELLMKTPDYEVKFRTYERTTWSHPFSLEKKYSVDDVGYVDNEQKEIILEE